MDLPPRTIVKTDPQRNIFSQTRHIYQTSVGGSPAVKPLSHIFVLVYARNGGHTSVSIIRNNTCLTVASRTTYGLSFLVTPVYPVSDTGCLIDLLIHVRQHARNTLAWLTPHNVLDVWRSPLWPCCDVRLPVSNKVEVDQKLIHISDSEPLGAHVDSVHWVVVFSHIKIMIPTYVVLQDPCQLVQCGGNKLNVCNACGIKGKTRKWTHPT